MSVLILEKGFVAEGEIFIKAEYEMPSEYIYIEC